MGNQRDRVGSDGKGKNKRDSWTISLQIVKEQREEMIDGSEQLLEYRRVLVFWQLFLSSSWQLYHEFKDISWLLTQSIVSSREAQGVKVIPLGAFISLMHPWRLKHQAQDKCV